MSGNSSAPGFLKPTPQPPTLNTAPPGRTLVQFIQSLLVGVSGLDGTLVRPSWQPEDLDQPDLPVNWVAFGIAENQPDANAYQGTQNIGTDEAPNNVPYLQRNELLRVDVSVYGPQSYDNIGLIRDGFQISQNVASLKAANMGFAFDGAPARHVPDLVNGRWIDRWIMEIYLRRQIQRFYPILTFLSASGIIYAENPASEVTEITFNTTGS